MTTVDIPLSITLPAHACKRCGNLFALYSLFPADKNNRILRVDALEYYRFCPFCGKEQTGLDVMNRAQKKMAAKMLRLLAEKSPSDETVILPDIPLWNEYLGTLQENMLDGLPKPVNGLIIMPLHVIVEHCIRLLEE